MNTETVKRSNWQISLANVLAFMLAVGLWFSALTLTTPDWLSNATLVVMLSGMAFSYLAWRRRRFGILLLIILFEFIVVGQLLGLSYLHALNSERYHARKRLLRTLSASLNAYYSDWKAFPPPPADSKLGSSELVRYLTLNTNRGPYIMFPKAFPGWTVSPDGKSRLTSSQGHLLTWVMVGPDKFILIDMGEDGLPGQYTWNGDELLKAPLDANKNGIDDGNDDAAQGGFWDGIP